MTETPRVLWQPDSETIAHAKTTEFRNWLETNRGVRARDYDELLRWSITDIEGFWDAVAQFAGVRFHDAASRVLADAGMPGATWFPGATLNYAEHALFPPVSVGDNDVAVVFVREDGVREELTYAQLRDRVAAARAALVELGVSVGDRVVALAPNCPATLVAFLAAASIGAIWSSCSPDFGQRAVADRFSQIEPTVLFAVDGYVYGGRSYDIRPTVDSLRAAMPGLQTTVLIPYLGADARLDDALRFDELLGKHAGARLEFDAVPFDHPLWVLYSSGTTGLPKGIVQGHGGIVVEHLKALMLHFDLGPADRFFWFTTTGWMMWNLLIGGLMVGSTVVLYDGNPGYPDMGALWRLADSERVTYLGTSASFVQACLKDGQRPAARSDMSRLRAIGSTGSPLSAEGFRWLAEEVSSTIPIVSTSGGTDLCTAFVGASPDVPIWEGEISVRMLGADVVALDEVGAEVHDEVGELVVRQPMPSMPVFFWNDPDGRRLHEAYFDMYPGLWRHGDWIKITPRGSSIIYGRSDSTLNRGGVRMGTADFYSVVEGHDGVLDSLVIDTTSVGEQDGELLCFLVLAEGVTLDEVEPALRSALRSELSPRHVPNRFFVIDQVPRTLNGKKCEVPVKRILAGVPADKAVSTGALSNPDALTPFLELAAAHG